MTERPLSHSERAWLALSGAAMTVLCYAFVVASIGILLVVLAAELVVFAVAIRFGLAGQVGPLMKRHAGLLWMFVRSFRTAKGENFRVAIGPNDAPRLFEAIARLCRHFEVTPPTAVFIEMGSNAWVQLKGYRRGAGRTEFGMGYDLLAALPEGEAEAVLGHEAGHARYVQRGMKTFLGAGVRLIAGVSTHLTAAVQEHRNAGKSFELAEALLSPAGQITAISARLMARYSRQDEFEADRVSADLFGAGAMRSALVRLHLIDEKLRRLPWAERIAQLENESGFSRWLVDELATPAEVEMTADLEAIPHDPYSTHPALKDRIAALPPNDGRRGRTNPAIAMIPDADRVAEKLVREIMRLTALQEQKDTRALARWSRKNRRQQLRLSQLVGVMLILGGLVLMLINLHGFDWFIPACVAASGYALWRFTGYRDRFNLPTPRYAELKAKWMEPPASDIGDREKTIEEELRRVHNQGRKKQRALALIQEGYAALGRCDYLRAHVAARLALDANKRSAEAALAYLTASAGLRFWPQMHANIAFVQKATSLRSPSSIWGMAWAFSLAGDWGAAEALLWQAHEKQPRNTTFLMLLALSQSNRGKMQSAVANASKGVEIEPDDPEHIKLLTRLLLDMGRITEAEKHLRTIEDRAGSDPETAMLLVRTRLMRRQWDEALAAVETLRQSGCESDWLIALGETFESARRDQDAETFFGQAADVAFHPAALLGLSRMAANRRDKAEATRLALSALNTEKEVGQRSQGPVSLFYPIMRQLSALDEMQEGCTAWIVTFPAKAEPAAFNGQSITVIAQNRKAAEALLDRVSHAMVPSGSITSAASVQWKHAPKDQQPLRPVQPGML